MVKIYFHKSLQKFTDVKEHVFDTTQISTIVSGLKIMFPKFERYIVSLSKNKFQETLMLVDKNRKVIDGRCFVRDELPEDAEELWLVPTIFGGGKNILPIIIGVALIALAVFGIPAIAGVGGFSALSGIGLFAAKTLLGIGINLVLGALLGQTGKPKQNSGDSTRSENDIFSGLINTIDTGIVVPLNYGLVRVGGQLITGFIDTINHGKNDTVRIDDYLGIDIADAITPKNLRERHYT